MPSLWQRLADPEKHTWKKEDCERLVYWGRQLVAGLAGLLLGAFAVYGGLYIVAFVLLNITLVQWLVRQYLGVDEVVLEDSLLLMEGLTASTGLFVLTWILTYNAVHGMS